MAEPDVFNAAVIGQNHADFILGTRPGGQRGGDESNTHERISNRKARLDMR